VTTHAPTRYAAALARASSGTALVATGVVTVLVLHVLAIDEVDPVRRTLSQYALGPWKPVFDAGVLAVAVGSVAVLVGLARTGLARVRGTTVALLAVWSACLLVVVAFEKIDWSVGPTPTGYVHRYASLLAFFCLPVAALALGRAWRDDARWSRFAASTRWLGIASLAWLAPILLGFVLRPLTGIPWWQFVPLGLFERGLALTEVAAVVVMGVWAVSAARRPALVSGA
jgi:energy-converting hydrogenase Eha subunit A